MAATTMGLFSCSSEAPPTGAAVEIRDSIPVMVTTGVSKLISDSGVIRYKIVAEEWETYDLTNPPRQVFPKGLFFERYDEKFNIDLSLTADTAYCYNENLWEFRGRVFVRNIKDETFSTEELFWDMEKHEIFSYKYMHIITPDEELEGNAFRSNEQMTNYVVSWARGIMPMPQEEQEAETDSLPPRESTLTDPVRASATEQQPAPQE